ncbi:MAG: hypothetical protein H0X71_01030 [Rubrobacter sp.]|nr:hypothetical protein [Rubrobacter sp.]
MVSDMAGLPAWEASLLCMVCDDEVPDEHFVVSHLLTPHSLAVCYECFSWRDTWDHLADEYFFTHVDHWKDLCGKKFGDDWSPGS